MKFRILSLTAAVTLCAAFGLAANVDRAGPPDAAPDGRFAELDRNGDGGLDRSEVAAAAPRWAERFERVDRNRDARIDRRELGEALRVMAARRELAQARREALRAHFVFLDTDGDRALTLVEIGQDAPRLAEKFGVIDANRDGRVAAEELHAHLKAERDARRAARAG